LPRGAFDGCERMRESRFVAPFDSNASSVFESTTSRFWYASGSSSWSWRAVSTFSFASSKSQAAQGWKALPTRYDDGGFTGGNLERPALTRLMDDIERGEIDTVVVYKVDRLSRSLLDFARLVERFEKRRVAFVSITQHFDTSTSMGRLVLHILLSFAQFDGS
jgi:hypothetical protein